MVDADGYHNIWCYDCQTGLKTTVMQALKDFAELHGALGHRVRVE